MIVHRYAEVDALRDNLVVIRDRYHFCSRQRVCDVGELDFRSLAVAVDNDKQLVVGNAQLVAQQLLQSGSVLDVWQ